MNGKTGWMPVCACMCGQAYAGKAVGSDACHVAGVRCAVYLLHCFGYLRMGKREGERLQIEHIREWKLYQGGDTTTAIREGFENRNAIK